MERTRHSRSSSIAAPAPGRARRRREQGARGGARRASRARPPFPACHTQRTLPAAGSENVRRWARTPNGRLRCALLTGIQPPQCRRAARCEPHRRSRCRSRRGCHTHAHTSSGTLTASPPALGGRRCCDRRHPARMANVSCCPSPEASRVPPPPRPPSAAVGLCPSARCRCTHPALQ